MKKFLTFVTIFVALFLVVGCGGKGDDGPSYGEIPEYSEAELKNLKAEVTFWHAMGQSNQAAIDKIIKSFNKLYPNITVTQASQGGYTDLRDKIAKSIRAGNQPTIAQVYPDHVSLYLEGGAVRELDSYISHPVYGLTQAQVNDYIQSYYAEGKIYDQKGTLYSLPFNKSTEVMFINATWFEENGLLAQYNLGQIKRTAAGVKYFELAEGGHLTWEDIEEIAEFYVNSAEYQAMSEEEKADHFAFSYDSSANLFITITQQWGGQYTELTGENQGKFVFDNAQSRAAVEWYYNLYKAGKFVTAKAWGADYTSDKFKNQNVLMTVGSSAGCSYNDPGDKFVLGVLPYPQKEAAYGKGIAGGEYVIQQGTNVALFNCDNRDEELAGWLFMRFLTSWTPNIDVEDQATYIWCTETGYFPILTSLRNSAAYQSYLDGEGDGTRALAATVSIVGYNQKDIFYTSPSFPGTSKCRDLVESLVDGVLYAGKSIDQAYREALAELK